MAEFTKQLTIDEDVAERLYGPADQYLRILTANLPCEVVARGDSITLRGVEEQVLEVERLFLHLMTLSKVRRLEESDIHLALQNSLQALKQENSEMLNEIILITHRGKQIRPKTLRQKAYLQMIREKTITFAVGPAGTGKTYLAVVMAVRALKKHEVERIILTRPAVEAGEKLGFLPGDLQEKIDPYLRPLYDGLYDTLGQEQAQRYLEKGVIEIAPLAYMRGRTLDDAFIILDEAQNTTPEQMKMFLTRIGFGSKVVVTGDITQVDLPRSSQSGLAQAKKILQDIQEIGFFTLLAEDVVRHPVVAKIIRAYDRHAFKENNHESIRKLQEEDGETIS